MLRECCVLCGEAQRPGLVGRQFVLPVLTDTSRYNSAIKGPTQAHNCVSETGTDRAQVPQKDSPTALHSAQDCPISCIAC